MTMKPILTLILFALLGGQTFAAANPATADKPNVLFVIVDDLNCRIGCYGDPVAKAPNLDRLAARGVRFDRAYCNFPLCNPTRSSVLSGLYPTTTGVLDNKTWLVPPKGHPTLPQHFQQHGYARAEFGKIWHEPANNGEIDPANPPKPLGPNPWYTPAQRAEQQRTQSDFWTITRNYDHYRADPPPESMVEALRKSANAFGPVPVGKGTPDITHADEAIRFLQGHNASVQPFFLAVGFKKPHVPLKAPQEYFDLYKPEELPLPPDFANEPTLPRDADPRNTRRNLDLYADRAFTAAEARAALHAYYACVSFMDAQLGRVLDAIEAAGQTQNTLVVLWGDHGWHLSEKGMWAKGTLFEDSARAPLIVVDPRRKTSAGRICRRIVQFVDIYSTLADLAGLPLPPALEGVSLRPLLDDPEAVWDKPAFTVQSRGWSLGRRIRTERWAYSEWDGDPSVAMLFDHDADPHELRNRANDPAHAKIVVALRNKLRKSPVAAK
ncbi:MAG: sulfatase [Verrucomicrobia bacterium]|nr:sulfatase [Verrucomicrobiota bacterium]